MATSSGGDLLSITRSRRGRAPSRNRTAPSRPLKRPVDPSAHSLPGTALHRLALLLGEASRGLHRTGGGEDVHLHLRNPLEVAKGLEQRLTSLSPVVQKRVAKKLAPELTAPRLLPLDLVSLLVGVVLVATQRYWALLFAGYGGFALAYNSLARRRFNRHLRAAFEEAVRPDLQLLSSDRSRAKAIAARFADSGSLDFLDGGEAPAGVQMPQGERVLMRVDKVLKARETRGGLLREAEGALLVTTARVLFSSADGVTELELHRVVRTDVIDELRLVVVPSKREAPGIYIALGRARTLAEVIRLAREELAG